jgi:hypothetical protein
MDVKKEKTGRVTACQIDLVFKFIERNEGLAENKLTNFFTASDRKKKCKDISDINISEISLHFFW